MYGILCGTFIDGRGGKAEKNIYLYFKRDRITRISREKLEGNIRYVDASDMTVLPGLIDAHKHVLNCGGSGMSVGLGLKQLKVNLNSISAGGVTSVLDLGSSFFAPALERAVGHRSRIFNAISILTCPGGYPAEYMPKKFYKWGAVQECGSFSEIDQAVSSLYRKGAACIKTAVVSRDFRGNPIRVWEDEKLRYLTDAAHGHGLKVCAHITYVRDYMKAARCGVDSAHHAAFDGVLEDETAELMIEKGMQLVPTVSLAYMMFKGLEERWICNPAYKPAVNQKIRENMRKFTEDFIRGKEDEPVGDLFIKIPKREFVQVPGIQIKNVKKYIEKGGKIAMGTDSALGFSLHDTPWNELKLLNQCGLTVEKTIEAATYRSASVFGREDRLGSLETGKKADVIAVRKDLTENIERIKDIEMVIIDGKFERKAER